MNTKRETTDKLINSINRCVISKINIINSEDEKLTNHIRLVGGKTTFNKIINTNFIFISLQNLKVHTLLKINSILSKFKCL
jgi:hypothetical protein